MLEDLQLILKTQKAEGKTFVSCLCCAADVTIVCLNLIAGLKETKMPVNAFWRKYLVGCVNSLEI